MYYVELNKRRTSNKFSIDPYLGCGYIKDSKGHGPRIACRINYGFQDSELFIGPFTDISYVRDVKLNMNRIIFCTGFEFFL
jgi:hypothetical protein